MKPAPLPTPAARNPKKMKVISKAPPAGSSKKKSPKMVPKKPTKQARAITPPPQKVLLKTDHSHQIMSSDDENPASIDHQQQISEDEDEEESEDEQDADSLRLGKRKRSPTARGLSPPKSVKDFSALKKYYRLASRNIPRFIHPWVNVQGIVLHGLLVKGILDLLAEDEEEDAEDDNDSETKESETPDQLEDLDLSNPLRTVFEIFAAWVKDVIEFYTTEILKPKTDEGQEQVDDDDDESIMNRNREARIKERAATATAVNGQQLDENEDDAAIVPGFD
ncbi:hypothetical protein EDD85DRAFT_1026376 [Armillaria nabsnona]|nr:hypothetical protein EDD85DRAFT_1026376 [Armillaria nabsnona]